MAIVPQRAIQLAEADAPVSVSHRKRSESVPTIELAKSGNVVTAIVVTCACGQTITLNCQYDSNSNSGEVQ